MAKRRSTGSMTAGEQISGTVLFVIYLVVLPFAAGALFRFAERGLAVSIPERVESAICWCALAIAAVVIFHQYLAWTSQHLAENLGEAFKGFLGGLVALYGLNELAFRLIRVLYGGWTNLNDGVLSAQVYAVPQTMRLILVIIAPFVEEVLFRGLVFGCLKEHNRVLAYLLSASLFALLPVWRTVQAGPSLAALAAAVQYLIPGLVLAGSYEYAGTLWAPFAIHAAANALALWTGV